MHYHSSFRTQLSTRPTHCQSSIFQPTYTIHSILNSLNRVHNSSANPLLPSSHTRNPTTTMRFTVVAILMIPTLAAADRLGGIDTDRACKDQYYYKWSAGIADFNAGCNAWKCFYPQSAPMGVDTNRAWVNQYGGGAYALCYNGGVRLVLLQELGTRKEKSPRKSEQDGKWPAC